jgi:hypothetical protein
MDMKVNNIFQYEIFLLGITKELNFRPPYECILRKIDSSTRTVFETYIYTASSRNINHLAIYAIYC